MSKSEILEIIKSMLTNSVNVLADEEFQRQAWFRNEGPDWSSYTETVTHFFDSCEFLFKNPVTIEYLGKENYEMLKKLYDLVEWHVDLIEERIDPDLLREEELLDDPNWHDIQTLAEKVEGKLKQLVKEKNHG